MSASNYRTIVVPAAVGASPGVISENVNGKVFATISSTDKFFVRADNRASIEQNSGRYFGNPDGPEFGRLIFSNFTAAPNTITYYAGNEMYKPDTAISTISATVVTSGKNAPTLALGSTGALASLASVNFVGTNGVALRKSFSVFNTHAADVLRVLGANGIWMHEVAPKTGYVVEAGSLISLYVPGANAITYTVCEVFYT